MKNLALLRWPVTLFLPVILYLCSPVDVSPKFPLFVGMTSMAVLAWAFNVFPAIGVAALLSFAYLLGEVAPAEVVFGPWTTVLPWLSFAAVIIGEAMDRTGLARRLALRCLQLTGGSFSGLLWGFFLGGIALGTAAALLIYHGMRLISKLRGTNLEAASPASAPSGSELEGEAYSKRHRSPAPQADA